MTTLAHHAGMSRLSFAFRFIDGRPIWPLKISFRNDILNLIEEFAMLERIMSVVVQKTTSLSWQQIGISWYYEAILRFRGKT
jgi:hypothetical protein